MIKRQTLIILAVLCMMALPIVANGIEDATIGIGDGSDYVTIPITITNATNAGTVDVTLRYDPDIVNVTNVAKGDMDNIFSNLRNATDGWVRIGSFKTGDGLNGAFILANVSFEPVGSSGRCPLEISVNEYTDATNKSNSMPYIVDNGTYTISYDAPSSRSNREGTYPPVPDDDDSGKNVTEEKPPVNETVVETPTAPPLKKLPGIDTNDEDDGGFLWLWLLIVLAAIAIIVGGYLLSKKNEDEDTGE